MEVLEKRAYSLIEDVQITGKYQQSFEEILTEEALVFIKALHERFNARRIKLLGIRKMFQIQIDNIDCPDFLRETEHIRDGDWKVAKLPQDLLDRRVEITGPVERKMVINALNSGANGKIT